MKTTDIAKQHFFHLLNKLPDGIFITDIEGFAIWANDTSTRQLGVPRSEIIGSHVEDLESKGLFTPSVTRIVMDKKESVSEVQTSLDRQYLATGYLTRIPKSNIDYILVQVKDITETVKASFQLEKAESLLQEYIEEIERLQQKQKSEETKKMILGQSKPYEEMIEMMTQVSAVNTTILLTGETGVGKSIVAKEIHKLSNRAEAPFIQINCGAIPESLLESELFGYKKGAFTGANAKGKTGLVEKAAGGTLFLDEIAELPLALQPKILQLAQEKSFIPVGGSETEEVDIRIISATNCDLEDMVAKNEFREDLYYRLNVVAIHIPALKERKDDIPLLIHHYKEYFQKQYNKNLELSTEAMNCLQQFDWPGNIRELENTIEFLVVTATSSVIHTKALPAKFLKQDTLKHGLVTEDVTPEFRSLPAYLDDIEYQIIEKAQKEYDSTRKAADALGMTQSTYFRRLKKYGLSET